MVIIKFGLISLLTVTPVIFCLYTKDTFALPKLVFFFIITTFMLARVVDWKLRTEPQKIRIVYTSIDVPFLVFIFVNLIANITSMAPMYGLMGMRTFFDYGLPTICYEYIIYSLTLNYFDSLTNPLDKEKNRDNIIFFASAASLIVVFYGLLQYCGLEIFKELPLVNEAKRVWSSFGNPLYVSTYLMIMTFLLIGQILFLWDIDGIKNKKKIIFYALVISLYIPLFVFSQSRGSWLGMGIGFLVFGLGYIKLQKLQLNYKKVGWGFAGIFCLAICALLFYPPARNKITSFRPGSDVNRVEGWKSGFKVFLAHPILGTGPDTFKFAFRQYKTFAYVKQDPNLTQGHAHGDWIQYLATTGIAGFLAYCYLWFNIFRLGIRFFRRTDVSKTEYCFQLAVFSALTATFVNNQFSVISITNLMLICILTAIFSLQFRKEIVFVPKLKSITKIRWCAYPIAVILSVVIVYFYFLPEYYYTIGDRCFGRNWVKTYVFTEKAIKIDPYQNMWYVQLLESCRALAQMSSDEKKELILHKAFEYSVMSTRYDKYNPDSWHNLGVTNMWLTTMTKEKRFSEAMRAFQRAIELDPKFVGAYLNIGGIFYWQGRYDMEEIYLTKVLKLDPKNSRAQSILGKLTSE